MIPRLAESEKKEFGPESPTTLLYAHKLSRAVYYHSKQEAVAMLRKVVSTAERVLGREDPLTLSAKSTLAYQLDQLRIPLEPERLARETLEIQQRLLGGDHPDTLSTMVDLGYVLLTNEKPIEAEELFRAVSRKKADGIYGRRGLGFALIAQGRLEEAERVFRELIANESRAGFSTVGDLMNLADVLAAQGRHAEADQMMRDALMNVPNKLWGMEHVTNNLLRQGDRYEAEQITREVVANCQRVYGSEARTTVFSMDRLAQILSDLHRFEEAESIRRESLLIRQRVFEDRHPETLDSLRALAHIQLVSHRLAEAEGLYRQAYSVALEKLGEHHYATQHCRADLANFLLVCQRYPEAVPLQRAVLEHARSIGKQAAVAQALYQLADALTGQGRFSEASQLWSECVALRRQRPDDSDLPVTLSGLGSVEFWLGRYDAAHTAIQEALSIAQREGQSDWTVAEAMILQGLTLAELKQEEIADRMIDEGWDAMLKFCQQIPPQQCGRLSRLIDSTIEYYSVSSRSANGKNWYQKALPVLGWEMVAATWRLGGREEAVERYVDLASVAISDSISDWARQRQVAFELVSGIDHEFVVKSLQSKMANKADSLPIRIALAHAHACLGEMEQAAADYNVALRDTTDEHTRAAIWRLVFENEEVFHRVAPDYNEDQGIWNARGDFLALRNRWAPAAEAYHRAGQNVLYARSLIITGNDEAYREHRRALLDNSTTIDVVGLAGVCSLDTTFNADSGELRRRLQQEVGSRPDAYHYHLLGCLFIQEGSLLQAVDLLLRSRDAQQQVWSDNAFPLAVAYRRLGEIEEARKWYNVGLKALADARPSPTAVVDWYSHNWLCVNAWHQLARADFEAAERGMDGNDSLFARDSAIRRAVKKGEQQNWTGQVAELEGIAKKQASDLILWHQICRASLQRGHYDAALSAANTILEIDPNNLFGLWRKADALAAKGDSEQASEVASEA